ncbi:MAG: class I SAM-dependent methyltransferase [Kiloniellaceae bacterium]
MDDADLALLVDLHRHRQRQGPGGDAETAKAIALAGLSPSQPLRIADIGCGTGASTLQLARALNARIAAVDFLPDFIAVLEARAAAEGLSGRIEPLVASMEALPFADETFDVLWSEGAIYNMGFAKGVAAWRRFLKPGGLLAVSEITWLTGSRPAELQAHWEGEYPEIGPASAKLKVLEDSGYAPVGYFVLPERCWLDNYYRPLCAQFDGFLERHCNSAAAASIVEAEKNEVALYERFKAYYSYGVYLARRCG